MKRRQKRKLAFLVFLSVVLVAVGLWYWNFRATGAIALPDLRVQTNDVLAAPDFLYTFRGAGANVLVDPVGVATHDGKVYVTDSQQGLVFVFRQTDGRFVTSFGKGHLKQPLFLAFNPVDDHVYVSDRTQRSVEVFTASGSWVKRFNPNLPAAQRAKGETDQWDPTALTFAPDGTMYVVELLNGHRFLIFGPDGVFQASEGSYGLANTASSSPQQFQFPNSIKYFNGSVYVVDSNNRRVQVFSKAGAFQKLIPMSGLPRGMAFLPQNLTAAGAAGTPKFAVVDTLAHNGTVWTTAGNEVLTFGSQGANDGEFSYPNDIALGDRGIMFITDTYNQRVQAWGWRSKLSPLPTILPRQPLWYLVLVPLFLLPLGRRRRKMYATADFIQALASEHQLPLLTHGRFRWFVPEADYELLKGIDEDGVDLGELLAPRSYSETDAYALAQRFKIEPPRAALLAFAQQSKLIHTEDPDLMQQMKLLELDTVDRNAFVARLLAAQAKASKSKK